MARPSKQGLDYFPLDTDIFDADPRLRVLVGKFGAGAFALYTRILCNCYREAGYYVRCDEDFYELLALDLGMDGQRVAETVDYMVDRGLFDAGCFGRGILTSRGIQRRYQEAVRGRMSRRQEPMELEEGVWLLSEEETADYFYAEGFSREKYHKEKKKK